MEAETTVVTEDMITQTYNEMVMTGSAAVPKEVWEQLTVSLPEKLDTAMAVDISGARLLMAYPGEAAIASSPVLRDIEHGAVLYFSVPEIKESFHCLTHVFEILPTCEARQGAMGEIFGFIFALGFRCRQRVLEVEELRKLSSL